MNYAIIVLSIFILLLSTMLVFRIKLAFSLTDRQITAKLYLFGIRIVLINVFLPTFLYNINDSKRLKPVRFLITKEEVYLFKQIKSSVLYKLYYDDIMFKTKNGLGDASSVAIVTGLLNQICLNTKIFIKSKSKDTDIYYQNIGCFDQSVLEILVDLKVYFTIFDLIFAVILSFYRRGKYVKQKAKRKQS